MVVPPQHDHHFFSPHPDERPVFVVGLGRSGTTMLRLMLHRGPDLAMLSETWFGPRVWERRWSHPIVDPVEPFRTRLLDLFVELLGTHDDFPIDVDDYRRRVEHAPADLAEFLRQLGHVWAEREGKPRWGEKTPVHLDHVEVLGRMFPGATFCVMVRDPRDVAASLVQAPFTASTDPVGFAVAWRQAQERLDALTGHRAEHHLVEEGIDAHVLRVRYEDLVDDPDHQLRRICRVADLTYDPAMVAFHEAAAGYAPDQSWMAGVHRPVNRSSLQRWRTDLAPPQVRAIEAVAGPDMDRLGYERSGAASDADVELADALWQGAAEVRAEQQRPVRDHVAMHRGAYRDLLRTIG